MDSFSCFVFLTLAVVPLTFAQNSYGNIEADGSISEKSTTKFRKINTRSKPSVIRESCLNHVDAPANRVNTSDRLRRLRLKMKATDYDAYIVPSGDEHQSEFVAEYDKRREFISGFRGSAGTAVILQEAAALWTDSRYFLQAENELDCNWLLMKRNEDRILSPSPVEWIIQTLKAGASVGVDSKLYDYDQWIYLKKKLTKANMTLHADSHNLIDDIWNIGQGRVPESVSHIFIHDVKYAGKTWQEKIATVMSAVNETGASGMIITALDEISWLFNLRGHDSEFTPTFKAYALISKSTLRLYVKHLKLTAEVEKYLCPKSENTLECVQIIEYDKAFSDMKSVIDASEKILLSSVSSFGIVNLVPEEKRILPEYSPIENLKVVKNSVEILGMKNANLRDCVAIVDFIAMLDEEVKHGKHWDEMKAVRALTKYRQEQELNQGESFPTVSAFGSNAAIIHYQPQLSTNRNINAKHVYLLDSGGQYLDGTTDITRTFHFGEPNEFEVEAYTRVLMGVIDLITVVFPASNDGISLDILARRSLYAVGLDYNHRTSHGIGSFLGVHEGSIGTEGNYDLKPGMFLSNEPGFYEEDKFGIRLETIMMVVKEFTRHKFNNKTFYTFEPVSFVPFEPNLIDLRLLSKKQKEWLNLYNVKTRNSVGLELRRQNRKRGFQWLMSKTEHIPVEGCDGPASSVGWLCWKSSLVVVMIFIVVTM